jgi:hypothetical protein
MEIANIRKARQSAGGGNMSVDGINFAGKGPRSLAKAVVDGKNVAIPGW